MKNKFRGKISWSAVLVILLDVVIANLAIGLAVLVSSNFSSDMVSAEVLSCWERGILWYSILTVLVFSLCHMYHMIWSLVGIRELFRIVPAVTLSCLLGVFISLISGCAMPANVYFLTYIFTMVGVGGMRYSYRMYLSIFHHNRVLGKANHNRRVMIIGAGKGGQAITKELFTVDKLGRKVCCIIDDNPTKHGRFLEGVEIVGDRSTIVRNVERYNIQEIIFAIPSAQPQQRRDILDICNKTGCSLKALPGIYQMIDGEVSIKALRDVSVEDLLARDPVIVSNEKILERLQGRTVLVTGGGGTIGSELCRQISAHHPGTLIIFDIYENCAYNIQQELRRKHPELNLVVLIGSVRDVDRVENVFSLYHPDIVFHAAAHKHVPLMEDSPCESIKNNVFGTLNVARMADRYNADSFVLISSDKAVNPTNIMGASKRICEMIVQYMSRHSKTKFAAVRFGNVLGSNGSVVPLFRQQIEEGGPVTVTDRNIIRYFMTTPEAVSLVLQACAFAKTGEIYVLDMGAPVRIDDLARNMIRLSGLEPDVDIPVVYTGLRPGEKLFEELLMDEEGLRKTDNNLIYVGRPIEISDETFSTNLELLRTACQTNDDTIKDAVATVVPTYARQPVAVS